MLFEQQRAISLGEELLSKMGRCDVVQHGERIRSGKAGQVKDAMEGATFAVDGDEYGGHLVGVAGIGLEYANLGTKRLDLA